MYQSCGFYSLKLKSIDNQYLLNKFHLKLVYQKCSLIEKSVVYVKENSLNMVLLLHGRLELSVQIARKQKWNTTVVMLIN